ncbi:MAG: VCBS repeat-containing protein [Verrucomicrobia bacterium]|nr:VCBS repeat-containing protein [Verrucomicrobiota bacterium]
MNASPDFKFPTNDDLRLEVATLESGGFLSQGSGRFSFAPFPRLGQIAPVFGIALADVDGDGALDCVLAQNTRSPQPETGHMDGGLGLVRRGHGRVGFKPVWPATAVTVADLNGDGRPDVAMAVNNGPVEVFFGNPGQL